MATTKPRKTPVSTKPRAVPMAAEGVVPGSKTAEIERQIAEGDFVTALVPKGGCKITRDDGRLIEYPAGTIRDMPRIDAEHWFAKARGVEIID